ncbi:MAG: heavy metal translocating P-type ATPase [Peptostreptococcus sp.]|uniref:heavy metal translocating P-type ATPase n=1 Tax=Peptostreptococcus sp. TaxID=1262 RepID=UPI001CB18945|nr:heavy metal translocating P-type ATPase [Peptostreptococcus sp.]MBF1045178.1 heavy metal translocating P-type ATPase [Peptostreptococcus sp.]
MTRVEVTMGGLNCANCAGIIEEKVKARKEIDRANLNFINKKLTVDIGDGYDQDQVVDQLISIIDDTEPGLDISLKLAGRTVTAEDFRAGLSDQTDKDHIEDGKSEHGHGHVHEHEHKESNSFLIAAIILYAVAMIGNRLGLPYPAYLAFLAAAYILSGKDVILAAVRNIIKGNALDENFLMTVATSGAAAIGEYPEAVGVMLFYGVGEALEELAVGRSRRNIEALMDIAPQVANLIVDGQVVEVRPEEVKVGDRLLVKVGERVPLDGLIVKGQSRLDTSAITGESVLRSAREGDEVLSGVINKEALIEVEVTKLYQDSTVARILDMVENASANKSNTENFISVFAKYYTPIVVGLAIAIMLLPPLVGGQDFKTWLYRGLIFLVVSCPCALVLSIPLTYFSGIGLASSKGILVKGSNYLDALISLKTIVFDKTGTLTEGVFKVININRAEGVDEKDLMVYACIAESSSNHPIAKSILAWCQEAGLARDLDKTSLTSYQEIPAQGIKLVYQGQEILAGNARLMEAENIDYREVKNSSTKVYIAVDSIYKGCVEIADQLRPGIKAALADLKGLGVENLVMLTGDSEDVAKELSDDLGLTGYKANLLPNQKVEIVEDLMKDMPDQAKLAFIGDGINDAPVIARADVGLSMGGIGSDAAIEASDIVIMTDEMAKLPTAIRISRMTKKIAWQNIILAIGIKILVMVLGTLGIANMWMAIFADVGVAILAVINSLRILVYKL